MSKTAQNAITILSLILFFPLGIFLMFYWNLYTRFTKIFICGCLFLFFGTLGFAVWKVSNIIAKVDSLVPTEIVQANGNTAVKNSLFQKPIKDIFEQIEMPINANGVEINIKSITRQKYTNKILKESVNYCAVTLGIKNKNTDSVIIAPAKNFMLSVSGMTINFPLTNVTGLGGFESKPEGVETLGENDFELKPGEEKSGFIPFECRDFKENYIFQSDINQFSTDVITGDVAYQSVKVKLTLPPEEAKPQ
jgi:hypothetical protein